MGEKGFIARSTTPFYALRRAQGDSCRRWVIGNFFVVWGREAALKGFFQYRVGYIFRGSRRNGGFNQHKAVGFYFFADDFQAVFQGFDFGVPLTAIAQRFLEVIALDVHDHYIGQAQGVFGVGGN